MKGWKGLVVGLLISLGASSSVSGQELAVPGAPTLLSPSAVLMDAASGEVLLAKNPHEVRNPASVTKLMTLAVVYEAVARGEIAWNDPITASRRAQEMGGSQVFLAEGETFALKDLVAAVAISSANDAAVAVAEGIAGSQEAFLRHMEELARTMGLRDSRFKNVHGLDAEGHGMSAMDIALLSRWLVNRHPEILQLTRTWTQTFRPPPKEFVLVNTNTLLKRYPGVDGLKTGWTSASGWSVAITAQRGTTRLIAVVVGAPTSDERWKDITAMLDWGFAHFESLVVAREGATVRMLPVDEGIQGRVAAVVPETLAITLPKGERQKVRQKVELPARVRAPLKKGQTLGALILEVDGKAVKNVPLVAGEAVQRLSFGGLWWRTLSSLWPWQQEAAPR
ncbi:MAG: D-alanyl-D-alanine carboxypeptidase family protein [Bacillota bacterium]|nr:D-alanyl-D-alanine carboxypeptidase family protein [Bacillota bacterium]